MSRETEPERATMMLVDSEPAAEVVETFPCFGGRCSVLVGGEGPAGSAQAAAARAKQRLLEWHAQFSRFDPDSELSRLNRDPRVTVPVSMAMARLIESAVHAAEMTGGLVDPTLVTDIERAGYRDDLGSPSMPLPDALALAPDRTPGKPSLTARWREIEVDWPAGTVTRPPGVRVDGGGIAKGLFGDILAIVLDWHQTFAVDAAGDVRFGGGGDLVRPVLVASPFDDSVLHVFELGRGAAATSGIGKRSWLDRRGRPAHHLLDPATGEPVFTGIVQVTALAKQGTDAEALAKAALLSGPGAAARWLPHGGVVVYDDGEFEVIEPPEARSHDH